MLDSRLIGRLATQAHREAPYPDPRFPPSIYYRFLKLLATEIRPRVSVELGVCGGGASLHLAWGYAKGSVIGVDKANEWPDNIAHIQETFQNFAFWYPMDSIEAAACYKQNVKMPVDILFIDTVHTYERTMAEYEAWRDLLAPNAVVCLDDLHRPGMVDAWDELPGVKMRLDSLHLGGAATDGGFGVIL